MLTALVLLLNFLGVVIAVYQVYDIYHEQSMEDEERYPDEHLRQTALDSLIEKGVDARLVNAASTREDAVRFLDPLRRRWRRLICNGRIQVRHLPFWRSSLPRRDMRLVALSVVLVNCLLVLFLGALSLYTVIYEIPGATFAWMNSAVVSMCLIYGLLALTHVVAWLDRYTHDLYKIGQLNLPGSS